MRQTRKAVQTPLWALGATLVMDDATGVGIADDVLLRFLTVSIVATSVLTSAPASIDTRQQAYEGVVRSAKIVSGVMDSGVFASSGITSKSGERQYCIDRYVDCQVNGHRNFPRSHCQPCMDQCLGQGFD